MKIQSVADIITNSSSEVFVIQTDKTWKEVEDIIESWNLDDEWSGMGGIVEVYDNKRPYADGHFCDNPDDPWFKWCPDGHLAIHIDWSKKKHIAKMFEEFNVVDSDTCNLVRNKKTGKTRKYDYSEKELQEDEEYLPGGFTLINKAKQEFAEKEMREAEEEMNKISDMETAKKFYKLYKKYDHAMYTVEACKEEQEEAQEVYEDQNEELHKSK